MFLKLRKKYMNLFFENLVEVIVIDNKHIWKVLPRLDNWKCVKNRHNICGSQTNTQRIEVKKEDLKNHQLARSTTRSKK